MSKATISKWMLQFCLDSHIFSNYYQIQTFLFGVLKLGQKKLKQGGALIFNTFSQVSFSAIFHEI